MSEETKTPAELKTYNPNETCPKCGAKRHQVRACFGKTAATFGCAASDVDHLHRDCLRCGASMARAAKDGGAEKLTSIVTFDEREIAG